MPTLQCPACGANAPVSLATPERFRCPNCAFQGAPDAASAERLRSAAHALSAGEARGRQLDERQRRALVSAGRAVGCTTPLVGIVLFLLLVLTASFVADVGKPVDAGTPPLIRAVVMASVFIGACTATVFGVRSVRRNRMRLGLACAARPSPFPGEPATCHCCGGPLVAGEGSFARCSFCQADNLLDPEVMQRATAHGAASTRDLVEQVTTQARAVATASAATFGRVLLVSVVTFFAVPFAAGFFLTLLSHLSPLAVDTSRSYAFVQTPQGSCIVRAAAAPPGTATFAATALLGRTLRTKDGRVGRVEQVLRTLTEIENVVRLETHAGAVSVIGLCEADQELK